MIYDFFVFVGGLSTMLLILFLFLVSIGQIKISYDGRPL